MSRKRAEVSQDDLQAEIPTALTPPDKATHWKVRGLSPAEDGEEANAAGLYEERLSFHDDDGHLKTAWPVAEYSENEIGERWGDGTYAVIWCVSKEKGQPHPFQRALVVVGRPSHVVEEEDEEEEEEAAPEEDAAAAAPPARAPRANAPATPLPKLPPIPIVPSAPTAGGDAFAPIAMALQFFQYFDSVARAARAEARQEMEFALKRYEIDARVRTDEQRQAHEKALEQQRMFYQESRRARGDAPALDARGVADELEDLVTSKLDDMKDEIVEELKGGAKEPTKSTAEEVAEVVNGITGTVPGIIQAVGAIRGTPAS